MYLPTAAGQSSFENETKKPFGWHSLPANCNGPASAPTAKMPASTNDLNTGMSVFEAPSPVTKSTLASSMSFEAPCTASAGLVLSSTTVYLTGRPPSLLPSSSRARSMPRLVSVPAGEIGPLSCVRLPSLTWSAACVPVQRASSVVEARAIRRIVVSSLWRSFACNALANLSSSGAAIQIWLEADEAADGLIFAAQGARVSAPAHASALEHVMAVGKSSEDFEILVHDQDRLAAALELTQHFPDLAADDGGEAFGCLVQDQQLGVGHQGACDRQHLLLPARELAAHLRSALADPGKELEDRIGGPTRRAARSRARGRGQIFPHREARKDAAPFRHQAEPELGDAERGEPAQLPPFEHDAAAARRRHAHDRADGGGLAHAVPPEQRHHLAPADFEIDAEQHLALAVARLEPFNRQHGRLPRHPLRRDRPRARRDGF